MVRVTYTSTRRKNERGQTLVLVALAIVSLLGMAALAIDVVTLYVAHAEAQRAADSAAIAGAKMFVTSGFTSVQGGLAPPVTQADVCQTGGAGSTAAANRQAEAVTGQNQVAGQAAAVSLSLRFYRAQESPDDGDGPEDGITYLPGKNLGECYEHCDRKCQGRGVQPVWLDGPNSA